MCFGIGLTSTKSVRVERVCQGLGFRAPSCLAGKVANCAKPSRSEDVPVKADEMIKFACETDDESALDWCAITMEMIECSVYFVWIVKQPVTSVHFTH